jgi:hypothetical protein
MKLREPVVGCLEVQHARSKAAQGHRLFLLVANFSPGLDDVFGGVGAEVQRDFHGVLRVTQLDGGMHLAIGQRVGVVAQVAQFQRRVAIVVHQPHGGLK